MVRFERPPGPLNVWRIVDGYEPSNDGTKKPVKYSIQEIPDTPERKQEAVDLMCNHFLDEEAISKCLKFKEDPDAIDDCKLVWKYAMDLNTTVGCYKLNSKGEIDESVGVNLVYVATDETENDFVKIKADIKSKSYMTMWEVIGRISEKYDVKKIYNVDKYISSVCFCMNSAYRGQKLGFHLLDARKEISKKYGCAATKTLFSTPAAHKQAARAGFEDVFSIDYKDLVDNEGNPLFPNIESPCLKVKMRRLP